MMCSSAVHEQSHILAYATNANTHTHGHMCQHLKQLLFFIYDPRSNRIIYSVCWAVGIKESQTALRNRK